MWWWWWWGGVDQVVTALSSLDLATVVVQASPPLQQVKLMAQVQAQAVVVAVRVQVEAEWYEEKRDLVGSEQHPLTVSCLLAVL